MKKRILKSGICNRKIDRKGGISDIIIGQESGILIQDFLQKGSMHQVNNSDFCQCWKGRQAFKNVEEYAKLFDNLKNNVKSNPDMLYKDYWK